MERTVSVFCESANGITGIARYIQALTKHLTMITDPSKINLQLSARWLHRIPQLDKLGLRYKTSRLPGRLQGYLRNRGVSDRLLYGSSQVVHEPNYMLSQVSKRTRVVMTVHDIGWRLSNVSYGLTSDFITTAETAIRHANRIITPTDCVKTDVVNILGVSPEKVTVIPPGIDNLFLTDNRTESTPVLPERYWLFVGAVTPRKNLDVVIDVLSTMEQRLPLVIVGPNIKFLDELRHRTEQQGVELIHISGASDSELVQIYKKCTGLIYPSLWEGFGFPIIEAAACGAPVITSNNTSMREIGKDYAWLVEPNNPNEISRAMRHVCDVSDYERVILQRLGRELAMRYSWDNTAHRHLEVYEQELSQVTKR